MGASIVLNHGYLSCHYSWVAFVPSLMGATSPCAPEFIPDRLGEFPELSLPYHGCQQCFESWVSVVSLLMGRIRAVTHACHLLPCTPVNSRWAWRGSRIFAAKIMGVSSALCRGYPSCHYSWVAFVPSLMGATCYLALQLIPYGLGVVPALSVP